MQPKNGFRDSTSCVRHNVVYFSARKRVLNVAEGLVLRLWEADFPKSHCSSVSFAFVWDFPVVGRGVACLDVVAAPPSKGLCRPREAATCCKGSSQRAKMQRMSCSSRFYARWIASDGSGSRGGSAKWPLSRMAPQRSTHRSIIILQTRMHPRASVGNLMGYMI